MKIQTLLDFVLIKRLPSESVSQGGIVLPESSQKKSCRGEVISVGPGRWTNDGQRIKMSVNVGDVVIFEEYTGTELNGNEDKCVVIREGSILAVLE